MPTLKSLGRPTLWALLGLSACGESVVVSEDPVLEGFSAYAGDFECDELDADPALLLWDDASGSGWFGWVPSNGGRSDYVMTAVDELSFVATFEDVYGVDEAELAETVVVSFELVPNAARTSITGEGSVVRADGSVEACTIRLALERTAH